MKYNLLFFTLILISNYSFSQILPSYHAVHHKPDGIVSDNLILHLDASNPNSLNENDLSTWNDLTSNNNDLSLFSGFMLQWIIISKRDAPEFSNSTISIMIFMDIKNF